MSSTIIGIGFDVMDLSASYEVVGTSDNYSFTENLGVGSQLVDEVGDTYEKIISLKGNYGVFNVRVFAVNSIGIKSEFVQEKIVINPPEFDGSLTFSNLVVSNLPSDANVGSLIKNSPQEPGDDLVVLSEFIDKNIELSWQLTPPVGHALEGQSVDTELLGDIFFDHFEINIYKGADGNLIDGQTLNNSPALQSILLTDDPSGVLSYYRDFSLTLNASVFDDLDLERTNSVEVIAFDKFGETCTGLITGINYSPDISNFTSTIDGAKISFSWFSEDTDFNSVNINRLGIPLNKDLKYANDFQANLDYYNGLANAGDYKEIVGKVYPQGQYVLYTDGLVYQANSDITIIPNGSNDPGVNSNWQQLEAPVDFIQSSNVVSDSSFEIDQIFGYKYYYTIQAIDGFGTGTLYNVEETSISENGNLFGFSNFVEISNLKFRERGDDLIFDWDIVDLDGNPIDISEKKFIFTESDTPSLLGISGSLFDVDTDVFLTGITQGEDSESATNNVNGEKVKLENLHNAKVFTHYEYTRELNNEIYKIGGFPSNIDEFKTTPSVPGGYDVYRYGTGGLLTNIGFDETVVNVLGQDNSVYQIKANNYFTGSDGDLDWNTSLIFPEYNLWSSSEDYEDGPLYELGADVVEYNEKLYYAINDFGISYSSIGYFSTGLYYFEGNVVVAPTSTIPLFDANREYYINNIVLYDSEVYIAIQNQTDGNAVAPSVDSEFWRVAREGVEYSNALFKSLTFLGASSQNLPPIYDTGLWEMQTPENSSDWGLYAEPYDENATYYHDDIIYNEGTVYRALQDNPTGAPIFATSYAGGEDDIHYRNSHWMPVWERNTKYSDIVFGHVGIPESGKRAVGLELGLLDNEGTIIDKKRIIADNPAPLILSRGFQSDNLSQVTKVKFNFNYALNYQEKTTKVHLYRSDQPDFSILDEYGLAGTGAETFVKQVLGAADATFGTNINSIIDDDPPVGDEITGYYYKILPFDDFGSGVIYNVDNNQGNLDKVWVFPKNYHSQDPNSFPGPVIKATTDEVPGPVLNLTGDTSFENYFLNWNMPNAQINTENNLVELAPNDISYYEVWQSTGNHDDELIFNNGQALNQYDNSTGYRRIDVISYAVGDSIPEEHNDFAGDIVSATNIFNIPANTPSLQANYKGIVNEKRYFWVRAVDHAGNKSPFTGQAGLNGDNVKGLELTLVQAKTTDIADFEQNITAAFPNVLSLVPTNPFSDDINNGVISWGRHFVYYNGEGYVIGPGEASSSDSYVYWSATGNNVVSISQDQKDELGLGQNNHDPLNAGLRNPLRNILYSGEYSTSTYHPAGEGDNTEQPSLLGETDDFIIARNAGGISTPMWHAFANATIGTAHIQEAAITNAKIHTLTADKIRSAEIHGQDIQIGGTGQVRSAGFGGLNSRDSGGGSFQKGFAISGDGSFVFQGEQGKLYFDDGFLTLEGKFRQVDGSDLAIINLNAQPDSIFYIEQSDGSYTYEESQNVYINASFQNSRIQANDVRFKLDKVTDNGDIIPVFGYDAHDPSKVYHADQCSGFSYDPSADFGDNGAVKIAYAELASTGFDAIIQSESPPCNAVIVSVSGDSDYISTEVSTNIKFVADGARGRDSSKTLVSVAEQTVEYDSDGLNPSSKELEINFGSTAASSDGIPVFRITASGTNSLNQSIDLSDYLFGKTHDAEEPTSTFPFVNQNLFFTKDSPKWSSGVFYDVPSSFNDEGIPVTILVEQAIVSLSDLQKDSQATRIDEADIDKILSIDTISIAGLKEGSDAITVILSNEAHSFTANHDGLIVDGYESGGTDIEVFQGTTPLTAKLENENLVDGSFKAYVGRDLYGNGSIAIDKFIADLPDVDFDSVLLGSGQDVSSFDYITYVVPQKTYETWSGYIDSSNNWTGKAKTWANKDWENFNDEKGNFFFRNRNYQEIQFDEFEAAYLLTGQGAGAQLVSGGRFDNLKSQFDARVINISSEVFDQLAENTEFESSSVNSSDYTSLWDFEYPSIKASVNQDSAYYPASYDNVYLYELKDNPANSFDIVDNTNRKTDWNNANLNLYPVWEEDANLQPITGVVDSWTYDNLEQSSVINGNDLYLGKDAFKKVVGYIMLSKDAFIIRPDNSYKTKWNTKELAITRNEYNSLPDKAYIVAVDEVKNHVIRNEIQLVHDLDPTYWSPTQELDYNFQVREFYSDIDFEGRNVGGDPTLNGGEPRIEEFHRNTGQHHPFNGSVHLRFGDGSLDATDNGTAWNSSSETNWVNLLGSSNSQRKEFYNSLANDSVVNGNTLEAGKDTFFVEYGHQAILDQDLYNGLEALDPTKLYGNLHSFGLIANAFSFSKNNQYRLVGHDKLFSLSPEAVTDNNSRTYNGSVIRFYPDARSLVNRNIKFVGTENWDNHYILINSIPYAKEYKAVYFDEGKYKEARLRFLSNNIIFTIDDPLFSHTIGTYDSNEITLNSDWKYKEFNFLGTGESYIVTGFEGYDYDSETDAVLIGAGAMQTHFASEPFPLTGLKGIAVGHGTYVDKTFNGNSVYLTDSNGTILNNNNEENLFDKFNLDIYQQFSHLRNNIVISQEQFENLNETSVIDNNILGLGKENFSRIGHYRNEEYNIDYFIDGLGKGDDYLTKSNITISSNLKDNLFQNIQNPGLNAALYNAKLELGYSAQTYKTEVWWNKYNDRDLLESNDYWQAFGEVIKRSQINIDGGSNEIDIIASYPRAFDTGSYREDYKYEIDRYSDNYTLSRIEDKYKIYEDSSYTSPYEERLGLHLVLGKNLFKSKNISIKPTGQINFISGDISSEVSFADVIEERISNDFGISEEGGLNYNIFYALKDYDHPNADQVRFPINFHRDWYDDEDCDIETMGVYKLKKEFLFGSLVLDEKVYDSLAEKSYLVNKDNNEDYEFPRATYRSLEDFHVYLDGTLLFLGKDAFDVEYIGGSDELSSSVETLSSNVYNIQQKNKATIETSSNGEAENTLLRFGPPSNLAPGALNAQVDYIVEVKKFDSSLLAFAKSQTFSISIEGERGGNLSFRGSWSAFKNYNGNDGSGLGYEIVYYETSQSKYWIAKQDSFGQTPFEGSIYWESFGAEFENVATNLLLTENAIITKQLLMGVDTEILGQGGVIKSPNKEFGNSVPGFFLANTGNNNFENTPEFDVGGSSSYLRFSAITNKLEIKGSFINNSVDEDINFTDISADDPQAIFIGGGYNNTIHDVPGVNDQDDFNSLASAIVAGANNEITGRFSFIGGGYNNKCADNFSAIVGGYANNMPDVSIGSDGANIIGAGAHNTISGGVSNSIVNGEYNSLEEGAYNTILNGDNNYITDGYHQYINGGVDNKINITIPAEQIPKGSMLDLHSPNLFGFQDDFAKVNQGWVYDGWWPSRVRQEGVFLQDSTVLSQQTGVSNAAWPNVYTQITGGDPNETGPHNFLNTNYPVYLRNSDGTFNANEPVQDEWTSFSLGITEGRYGELHPDTTLDVPAPFEISVLLGKDAFNFVTNQVYYRNSNGTYDSTNNLFTNWLAGNLEINTQEYNGLAELSQFEDNGEILLLGKDSFTPKESFDLLNWQSAIYSSKGLGFALKGLIYDFNFGWINYQNVNEEFLPTVNSPTLGKLSNGTWFNIRSLPPGHNIQWNYIENNGDGKGAYGPITGNVGAPFQDKVRDYFNDTNNYYSEQQYISDYEWNAIENSTDNWTVTQSGDLVNFSQFINMLIAEKTNLSNRFMYNCFMACKSVTGINQTNLTEAEKDALIPYSGLVTGSQRIYALTGVAFTGAGNLLDIDEQTYSHKIYEMTGIN